MSAGTEINQPQKTTWIAATIKVGSALLLIGILCADVFANIFIVPKFEAIYRDMYEGHEPPGITPFVVSHYLLMCDLSGTLLTAGMLILLFPSFLRVTGWRSITLNILLFVALFQIVFTVVALFRPLIVTTSMATRS